MTQVHRRDAMKTTALGVLSALFSRVSLITNPFESWNKKFERHAVPTEGNGNQKAGWSLQQGTYHNHPKTGFYRDFTQSEEEANAWVQSGILPSNHIA